MASADFDANEMDGKKFVFPFAFSFLRRASNSIASSYVTQMQLNLGPRIQLNQIELILSTIGGGEDEGRRKDLRFSLLFIFHLR